MPAFRRPAARILWPPVRDPWPEVRLPRPSFSRLSRPAAYALLAASATAAIAVLLLAVTATERLAYRNRVLPGVRLAGVEVSGQRHTLTEAAIAAAAARLERDPIVARTGPTSLTLAPAAVGVEVDEVATSRAVQGAGRRGNALGQLFGPVLRRLRPVETQWVVGYDRAALTRVVDRWAGRLDRRTIDGTVRIQGTLVLPVNPRPGRTLDRAGAVTAIVAALSRPGAQAVDLPTRPVTPRIGPDEVARVAGQARSMLAGPVTVTVQGRRLLLEPVALGSAVRVRAAGGRLSLGLDEERLRGSLRGKLREVERRARDARFRVAAGKIAIIPSVAGQQLDLRPVTAAILRGERTVEGSLQAVEPERDTNWARSLGIRERVSTFTTRHKPGQPRVLNIHRAADLLRGRVVEPGGRFSLNQTLGPRTPARGFVRAPVIADGKFSEDYGGGVSQLATTTFNAIFFGGYKILAYQPHSYYIKRYPMGREATVSLPAPDLVFVNDSRSGILVDASYTDTAITVTFYGSREGRTVRAEGPTILATRTPDGTVEEIEDPNLPAGTVIKEPAFVGYDVEVFRVITEPGKPPRRERFLTRYKSSNPKVIRGTGGSV